MNVNLHFSSWHVQGSLAETCAGTGDIFKGYLSYVHRLITALGHAPSPDDLSEKRDADYIHCEEPYFF